MNICSKSGNIVDTSIHAFNQSNQHAALPPIKPTLYYHTYTVSLPMYRIQTAIKYQIIADSHIIACVLALVNGFS